MRGRIAVFVSVLTIVSAGWFLEVSPAAQAVRGNEANGRKLFLTYCFLCHGKDGKGEGYAAKNQPAKPRNLTDDAYMSTRTDEQLFEAISRGGVAFHGAITMPAWGESLTEQEIWDLVAYVRTLHRQPPRGVAARGAKIYTQYCWTCHGPTGKGNGPIAKVFEPRPRDFTDKAYMSSRTDYDLYTAISEGGAAVDRSPAMPAWGRLFKPQEIWDLVAYIRHLSKQQ
jgi:cbb3-type cytochrome c oxidase subunit III